MSETTGKEDDTLEEAISYIVASYKHPEGWDKNMK